MNNYKFDFYDSRNLKAYNLDENMKYQLAMLDRMDIFTRRHSENVANLVCRICEYLHLNKEFTVYATICGYLHDVGKLFIPPEILNKPGPLTDSEYEIMKTHTTKGYELCQSDLKLRPYSAGALYHHEALNGSGYPQGLTKEAIPYVAQIIRVGDEYDAIVTKRQYTTHVNISETLRELIKDAEPSKKLQAIDVLRTNYNYGKINKKVLRALFKVVIDDSLYEISTIMDYVEYLKKEAKRLTQITTYELKADNSTKEDDILYYKECMRLSFKKGETPENYKQVLKEISEAIDNKNYQIKLLYNEIKIIKGLKV